MTQLTTQLSPVTLGIEVGDRNLHYCETTVRAIERDLTAPRLTARYGGQWLLARSIVVILISINIWIRSGT